MEGLRFVYDTCVHDWGLSAEWVSETAGHCAIGLEVHLGNRVCDVDVPMLCYIVSVTLCISLCCLACTSRWGGGWCVCGVADGVCQRD